MLGDITRCDKTYHCEYVFRDLRCDCRGQGKQLCTVSGRITRGERRARKGNGSHSGRQRPLTGLFSAIWER